jgi:hypothetical protein
MSRTVGRLDGRTERRVVALMVCLSVSPTVRLSGQGDTSQAPVTTGAIVVPTDTTHRIGPMGAFWRSSLVPGWGQAKTGRPVAGALFASWEGLCAMMTLKAQSEAGYLKRSGSKNLRAKRQEVQDWLVLWIFNHLLAGAEAYVSGHLQDFPPDLRVRAFPGSDGARLGAGLGVSVPLPRP